jgi:hypothetical protein
MCIVRIGEELCGQRFVQKSDNSTSNYMRHLKDTKCTYHTAAHRAVLESSARSSVAKEKKRVAVIGCGAQRTVAVGAAAITHHMLTPRSSRASPRDMQEYTRRRVLWSAIDMRPCNVSSGDGYQLLIGHIAPAFAGPTLNSQAFNTALQQEYVTVKDAMISKLQQQHDELRGLPFCSVQLDLTTELNRSFCTLSVSFIDSTFTYQRFMLVNRDFPLDHKAAQISAWITLVRLFKRMCTRVRAPDSVHRL